MGTDDPAFDAMPRRRKRHFRWRGFFENDLRVSSRAKLFLLLLLMLLVIVFFSFALFSPSLGREIVGFDFDSGPVLSTSGRKTKKSTDVNDEKNNDGVFGGHSLVKGEDSVETKVEFWPKRFGDKREKVFWRRFALESMFEYSEDVRLLPKLAMPYGLNATARDMEEEKRRENLYGSAKKKGKKRV